MATAREIQQRRGTTAEHELFTGAEGELTVDIDKNTVVVHDGSTVGGTPLAKETAVSDIEQRLSTAESDINSAETRLDAAETNITNNQTEANDNAIAMSIALG